jgi:RNA polymerase sigma-70 factor (ECF subfamily)
MPRDQDLPPRLDAVLEAIYAAYGLGREEAAGVDPSNEDLAEEALWLARVVRQRMPEEPEVRGLLALILFCHSRRSARRGPDGRYVPLSEQDPATWSTAAIREAEAELSAAAQSGRPGRFQLEAAIQSVHAERAQTGRTDWPAIVVFYEHLVAWRRRSGPASPRRRPRRKRTGSRRPCSCSTVSTAPRSRCTSRTGPCAPTCCGAWGGPRGA